MRLLALTICAIAVAGSVYAQSGESYSFTADAKFSAANKVLEPGRYEAQYDNAGGFILTGGKVRVRVPVVTRLARTAGENEPPRFVFDKLETGDQILSEIWLPGQDGFLVCTLEKAHQHVTLKGQKKGA
ncbi:MAG: hypothetical protein ACM3NQ_20025 [Bacteroidales bacterium]